MGLYWLTEPVGTVAFTGTLYVCTTCGYTEFFDDEIDKTAQQIESEKMSVHKLKRIDGFEPIAEPAYDEDMNTQIPRNELNAEIKAIEARTDSKVAEIRGDIKALSAEMRSYMAEGKERDKRELIATSAEKAAESASSHKSHLWATSVHVVIAAVGTVVAAYFATQQSNIGITQSVISAFQQGQTSPPPAPTKK